MITMWVRVHVSFPCQLSAHSVHYLLCSHHFFRDDGTSVSARSVRAQRNNAMDSKFGYERYTTPTVRVGWLINMHPVRNVHMDKAVSL